MSRLVQSQVAATPVLTGSTASTLNGATFTPPALSYNSATGVWTALPDYPVESGTQMLAFDAPGALLPCAAG